MVREEEAAGTLPLPARVALARMLSGPALIVWLLLAALYVATMTPGLSTYHATGLDDAAEFQTVGSYWGFEHSPGYPMWTVLANLFVRAVELIAPATEPAWRVTLSSTLTAVAVLVMLSLLLTRLRLHPMLVAAATLFLGVGAMFWRHAVIAEMYVLNLLLMLLAISVVWSWARVGPTRESAYLVALGLLLGAMAVHHRTGLLVAPGLFAYMLTAHRRPWRAWLRAAALVALAALPMAAWYLYLPLASAHHARTGMGRIYREIHSVGDVWSVATASEWLPLMSLPTAERLLAVLAQQGAELFSPLVVVGGLIGLTVAGRVALPLLATALLFAFFGASFGAYDADTMLLPLTTMLVAGLALLIHHVTRWGAARYRLSAGRGEAVAAVLLFAVLFGRLEGQRLLADQSADNANLPMIEMVRLIAEAGHPISMLAYQHSSLATIQYLKARYGYDNLEPLYPNKLDEPPGAAAQALRARWDSGRYLYYSDDIFTFVPGSVPDIESGLATGRYLAVPTYLDRLRLLMPGADMPAIQPTPETPLDVELAEGVRLVGYDSRWVERTAGIFLELTLYWQVEREGSGPLVVALWPQGESVRGLEALRFEGFMLGSIPYASLQPGDRLRDSYQLRLNEGFPFEPFELQVNVESHDGTQSASRTAVLTIPPASAIERFVVDR